MEPQGLERPEREIGIRMMEDDRFREAMLSDPKATLEREFSVKFPEDVDVQVHVEDDRVLHIVVPGLPRMTKDPKDLDDIAEMMPSDPRKHTKCCTCGSSTGQTFSSFQKGCGCS
jgi:hypothetical protein